MSESKNEIARRGLPRRAHPEQADNLESGTPLAQDPLDLIQVLDSVRVAAYRWDFASDAVAWADNAATALDVGDIAGLQTGRAFALHIDPEHAGARYEGVTGGDSAGPNTTRRYTLYYRFLPDGRRGQRDLWVEDTGMCVIGADARPVRAQGTLRVMEDRRQAERAAFGDSRDELTGQLNRKRLTEALSKLHSQSPGARTSGAFLLVGVNDLTLVNETYGFDVGDEVISITGKRLESVLRGDDCIGRFSSNKFGIVLHDCSSERMEQVARRLMAKVGDDVLETTAGAVAASISVGAVALPARGLSAQTVMGRALQALDVARVNRGDQYNSYVPCERKESERRRNVAIADDIIRALNDRRLMIALQPIVRSQSHQPEFYECLLRMRRLDGSVVNACEFIHVAEQFGLSKLVDYRVLELAVEMLRASPDVMLALNVSALTATDPQWMAGLEALTGRKRTLLERLTIEITETAAISDVQATIKFVKEVKAMGCRVALDDFGAGYTSFRSLRDLGVDMVKIDGSFIKNLCSDAEDAIFVRTLIDLARRFGVVTVGEWVGDESTVKLLEQAGVSYMQGEFFGPAALHGDEAETADQPKSADTAG